MDTGPLVRVEVHPDTETLHTSVSRDVWDDYYEIPEKLVAAYERARVALDRAQAAITGYINDNGLKPRFCVYQGPDEED